MKIHSKIINQKEERSLSEESDSEITFSEADMEAAKQLVQLSEDDTLSCSSVTAWSVCEGKEEVDDTKRVKIQEDVFSSKVVNHGVGKEQNDSEVRNNNVTEGRRSFIKAMMEKKRKIKKKNKKFRSLESIYRATKEISSSAYEAKDDA